MNVDNTAVEPRPEKLLPESEPTCTGESTSGKNAKELTVPLSILTYRDELPHLEPNATDRVMHEVWLIEQMLTHA